MHTQDKEQNSDFVELSGILSEFRDALNEEIDKIKKSGLSSTLLFGGQLIQQQNTDFWYRFNIEYAPSLPADTPCKLLIGKDQFDVTVVSFEEHYIIISSKVPLPETLGSARLENGATVLMELLIKCIEDNAKNENPAGNRMFASSDGNIYSANQIFKCNDLTLSSNNTQSQNKAITSALSNDITYIWGPPGTGKTTVIAQIIDELYKHNRSVLIVSHTNTAVDGAIEKATKAYSALNHDKNSNYPILRLGTPAKPLPDEVLLSHHIAILGKELYVRKKALETQAYELRHLINKLQPLIAKSNWLKESNLELVRRALLDCSELEKEASEIQNKIETLKAMIAQEKETCPEYINYKTLSKELANKRREYDNVCMQIQLAEQSISVLPQKIQDAQDEIRKHTRYTELRAEESKYMSESFLKSQINTTNDAITNLQNTIDDLKAEQHTANQTIAEYEKKNSIAKFFTNKNTVNHAQLMLDYTQEKISVLTEDLHLKEKLKQEYSQQLDSLLLLQEQLRAVVPTKTQDFWNDKIDTLQSKLEATQKSLPDLSALKDSLYEEGVQLEREEKRIKAHFDAINALNEQLLREYKKRIKIRHLIEQKTDICSSQLKAECSLCASFFYTPIAEDDASLLEELSELYKSIKKELSSINIGSVQEEIELANTQLKNVSAQLTELNHEMQELEKQAIVNAKIVGTTLAKSYLNTTLRERKFDTVILDEASMASIPSLWCASYLADKNIVIVGDFLQLPPIVIADTPLAKKWLGKDIFHHSGMQDLAQNPDTCPPNFVMLNDQFRMESDIADIANMYYGAYGGLHSNDYTERRVEDRAQFYSWYSGKKTKGNIHLIDTESLHAWVTGVPQGKNHSRLNCFSAAVSVDLAFKFLENKLNALDPATAQPQKESSVLIIAPYKPHITKINQLIKLEYSNRGFKEDLNLIRSGTIHSFQGSEADIVIFDLVIDEPHWKANLFLTDTEVNESLEKMFNVAVTRAKFKLYIVGNFAYCQKRAKNNALSRLLEKLFKMDSITKSEAKLLLPDIVFERCPNISLDLNLTGKHIVCREDSFNDYFMADIKSFKKRLIIYSPFMTESRLSVLLPVFSDAIRAGKQIIVITKALSDQPKHLLSTFQKCEKALRDIGVDVLHKKGMHEKLVFIDDIAIWMGSLNVLSFTGLTGEVMQRHADSDLTIEYEQLFDIKHICDAIENTYEQKCPICNNEMLIKESDEGGIFWQCIEGDYSRNADQQYPVDGVLRCKCGAPYIFGMKNEPRWVCSENPKHFQKMRESDLKLEKMAALIKTKTARKEVDKYFSEKKKTKTTKSGATAQKKPKQKKQSPTPHEQLELTLF